MAVKLYRGDTWTRGWELRDAAGNPIDLTGASARLHVRDASGSVVISASTTDGRLTLTPASGLIYLQVPYAATGLTPGSYRFDLEVTYANGVRRTYEQNTLIVLEDVTHD